ncbi:MAG TPA: pilus assembly protein PilP [Candidatus Acidoferrales bacterium]|nr:pilus assembly protein PilP [Candidatus Acidoferrales bacterium]
MNLPRTLLIGVALLTAGACFAAQDNETVSRDILDATDTSPPYDPVGRRDPFRPFTLDIHHASAVEPATPLQRYDLGQLTVAGTIWEMNPPRAMIEDSAGMGYIVTIGTPIGRNSGLVTAIEPQRVVVEERVLDFYGNEQVNRIVMETPKEEGSSQPAREQK